MIRRKAGHRCLTLDPTERCQHLRQHNAAVFCGHPVGADPFQESKRILSHDFIFGKTTEIGEAYRLAHCTAFLRNSIETVVASETILLFHSIGGVPLGPLPAKSIGIDCPRLF